LALPFGLHLAFHIALSLALLLALPLAPAHEHACGNLQDFAASVLPDDRVKPFAGLGALLERAPRD
jgi:uncharacterized metal-binding protein YceD (DUF177 family)